MSLDLRNFAITVICGLFLMPVVCFAQIIQPKQIVFPEVEGWEKGDKVNFPTAELGYSVPYQSKTGGTVTVYVYNGGFTGIEDGVDSQTVKNEMKQAENDIEAFGEAGYYTDVKLIESKTVTLGGRSGTRTALYSLFSFKVRGTDVDSEIYIFGYQKNFIKIRATRPKGKNGPDNAEVNKLLAAIGEAF